jgi:hypothetical protein
MLDGSGFDPYKVAEQSKKYYKELDAIPVVGIGLPHDGESFNDPTISEFIERVEYLVGLGYNAPDDLIERLEEEEADGKDEEIYC